MTRSPLHHLGIAVAVLTVTFALFTLLPGILPHPEDFSPWGYLVAFLVTLVAWFRLPRDANRLSYAAIVILCTLAFLDEIGYGVEIFGWPPLYLEQYNVQIHDLHNLVSLGIELLANFLETNHWNSEQFTGFMLINLGLIGLCMGLRSLLRRHSTVTPGQWRPRLIRITASALGLVGLATVVYLGRLPGDEKNALLFGFSAIRIAIFILVLSASFTPVAFLTIRPQATQRFATRFMTVTALWLPYIALGAAIALVAYQVNVSFVFLPDQQARLERITPLIYWFVVGLLVVGLAGLAWQDQLQATLKQVWRKFTELLQGQPTFFYAMFAVVLIFIAQLIDQEQIPLNQLIATPNFHVQLWGLWTEEMFEMVGAFQFTLAAWYFPTKEAPK